MTLPFDFFRHWAVGCVPWGIPQTAEGVSLLEAEKQEENRRERRREGPGKCSV